MEEIAKFFQIPKYSNKSPYQSKLRFYGRVLSYENPQTYESLKFDTQLNKNNRWISS